MFFIFKRGVWQRCIASLLALLFVFQLSGCGDREPKQRSAFIIFLQTEIVNKNRINPPVLTKDQTDSFGEYAKHYQLLVDFDSELKTAFTPLAGSLQTLRAMTSMKEMVENRDKIAETLKQINDGQAKLKTLVQRIEHQKSQLVQPDDLKTPFDRAYEKIVGQQLEPAKEGFPLLAKLFTEALTLVDFVNSKGDTARLTNSTVEFSSQADVDKFNELNANLQKAQSDYLSFSQKGR
jgi:uncharacterized lipoprotein YehR (DUF1307 family)